MIEIDCRKCGNLAETGDSCKLYGSDPRKAAAACKADKFKNYKPAPAPVAETTPGTTVWVIARDEEKTAVEVVGYVFLACVAGAVIASPRINDYELSDMLEYHMEQTAEWEETSMAVFPEEDCYATKPAAMAAYAKETEA